MPKKSFKYRSLISEARIDLKDVENFESVDKRYLSDIDKEDLREILELEKIASIRE